jgi:hypothetical protein
MADAASLVQIIPVIREPLSRVPLRLSTSFEGKQLGIATGFTYRTAAGLFLITNWHVVTGRHPDTRDVLDRANASIPDAIAVDVPYSGQKTENRPAIWWEASTINLYADARRGQALWLEHPIHGSKVDVVAIPFKADGEHVAVLPANDPSLELRPLALLPSLGVYVIGFPLGLTGGASLPIWKRATIANEPEFPLDGMPKLYIDTATKRGMSGAPVFVNAFGMVRELADDGTIQSEFGETTGRRLVGVYASRIHAGSDFEAQLGIVWKAETIEEIVAGGQVGKSSFHP